MYEAGGGVTPTTIYTYHEHRYVPYLFMMSPGGGGGHSNTILACMFVKNEIFLVRGEESRGPRLDVIFVENLILNFLFCRINGVQNELCVDANKYNVCFPGGGGGGTLR